MPSNGFTRYNISQAGGFAIGITVDQAGNPWFGLGNGSIGTINQDTGKLKAYPLANANAGVGTIKVDANGNVWFTEGNAPGIGKLNPTTGKESEFLLPPASRQLTPTFLVIDSNGNVWFNEVDYSDATGGKLGRLSPDGAISEWSVPTVGAEIEEIALDSKGNLWFAEQGNISLNPSPNKVGKLDPLHNTITEYTSPTPNSRPAGIVVADDDTIWFSEHATDKIAHLFPQQASGVTTAVTPVSTGTSPASSSRTGTPDLPTNPVTTPAQATTANSQVTRFQGIVEYSLPHSGSLANTEDMRFDKKGNLFFENDATRQIGALIFDKKSDAPTIVEWAIPNGVGFFNIEFDNKGRLSGSPIRLASVQGDRSTSFLSSDPVAT
jgi:streptogramin lyase